MSILYKNCSIKQTLTWINIHVLMKKHEIKFELARCGRMVKHTSDYSHDFAMNYFKNRYKIVSVLG